MAKSAHSKVVFVPMQLQNDLGSSQFASGSGLNTVVQSESGEPNSLGGAGRAGVLNSISEL